MEHSKHTIYSPPGETDVTQLLKKLIATYDYKRSSLCSQGPNTRPDKPSPHHLSLFLKLTLIVPFLPRSPPFMHSLVS